MVEFKDIYMHKEVIKRFRQKMFTGIYRLYDVKGEQKQICENIKDVNDKIIEKITYKGFEMKGHDMKTYFVKTAFLKKFPFKITKTREIVYARQVYDIIEDVVSIKIPESDEMSFHEFIDTWFPIKHTHPEDVLIAKFCILTPIVSQSWVRVVTQSGFGKDSIVNSIISLAHYGRKVSKASPAKLFQLISEGYTAFNEIGGFSGESRGVFEDFFFTTADGNDVYEHSTTGSDKTGSKIDISEYGYNIFHNTPDYYLNKGRPCFEQMFSGAIVNRIFPVKLNGFIETNNQYVGITGLNYDKIVVEADEYFKQWIGRFYNILNNYHRYVLNFDIKKYDLEVKGLDESATRWKDTFTKIAVLVEKYARSKYPDKENQEIEFYRIMDMLYDKHKQAIKNMRDYSLI